MKANMSKLLTRVHEYANQDLFFQIAREDVPSPMTPLPYPMVDVSLSITRLESSVYDIPSENNAVPQLCTFLSVKFLSWFSAYLEHIREDQGNLRKALLHESLCHFPSGICVRWIKEQWKAAEDCGGNSHCAREWYLYAITSVTASPISRSYAS